MLSNPEIFANQQLPVEIESESQNNNNEDMIFALKIYHHFLKHSLSQDFFFHLKMVFDKNEYDKYVPYLFKVLVDKQKKAKIIEFTSFFNLEFFQILLSFDDYKKKILDIIQLGIPWIPGPANINLTKGFGSTKGDLLEFMSFLGPFAQISVLPNVFHNKEAYELIASKIYDELNNIKVKSGFIQKTQYFHEIISNYNQILAECFKSLLKKGDLQNVK